MTIDQRSNLLNALTANLVARAAHREGSVEADRLSRAASACLRYQTATGAAAAADLTAFGAPAECGRLVYGAARRSLVAKLQGLGYQSAEMVYDAVAARIGRVNYRMHCVLACD